MKFILLFAGLAAEATAAPRIASRNLLQRLPLRFEEAQESSGARFVARTGAYDIRLAPVGSEIEWTGKDARSRIQTRFVGANPNPVLRAEERVPGETNYFLGGPQEWRTGIAAYARVRYQDIYPGIDLVFHGEGGVLEYDFLVAAGADPKVIRLNFKGTESVTIDSAGDLLLKTRAGEIRWKRPELYQELNGKRLAVEGHFVMREGSAGFEIGAYNPTHILVIDPALTYCTYLGSTGNDAGRGIGLDSAGNVYIAGNTNSNNLSTLSAFQPNFGGQTANFMNGDAFVAKFSPAGVLVYLTYLGGSGDDAAAALAVDSTGNVYVTGMTTSMNFPLVNPYQAHFAGQGGTSYFRSGDAFVAKINPSGNKLLYSTYLGGSQDDTGLGIAVDGQGNAYVTGATVSMNFPVTTGAYQPLLRGSGGEPIREDGYPSWDPGDAFIAKLDPTGSQLLYSTFIGGTDDDVAWTIALDSSNNIYIGGCTISTDFPTTQGALQRTFGGTEAQNYFMNFGDGFVVKLNPGASQQLVYSTYFGAEGDDCVSSIAVDSTGSVYMTGATSSMFLPTTANAFQPMYSGYSILPFVIEQLLGDAFVAKLNPAGSSLTYLSYLGGSENDVGQAIAIDSAGNAYVTGFTDSTDFKITGNALQPKFAGDGGFQPYIMYGDAFLTVVNPSGTALLYSSYFGGSQDDDAAGIAVDGGGNVYITGETVSSNLPVTSNAAQKNYAGQASFGSLIHGDLFYTVFSGFSLSSAVITKVANAEGEGPTIAANTWVEIKGTGLSTSTRIWQNSDFVNNQLPTSLSGVSVTINGENAYVYYISPTQINILTPPDMPTGTVQVIVNNSSGTSAAFAAQAQALSPSFFIAGSGPYVLATHLTNVGSCASTASYCLVGPSSLYPGSSSPAAPGETIVLYMNGFGPVAPPVVKGSETQSGTLPTNPQVSIANNPAKVQFAGLVSPGLYQFNVVVPASPSGDDFIVVNYQGSSTASGSLLTIQ